MAKLTEEEIQMIAAMAGRATDNTRLTFSQVVRKAYGTRVPKALRRELKAVFDGERHK
jgi:hypothetical protein